MYWLCGTSDVQLTCIFSAFWCFNAYGEIKCFFFFKLLLFSNQMLFRSLPVLAWDSLRFPWNWPACCNTLTPSLSITWLGRGVWIILSLCLLHLLCVGSEWIMHSFIIVVDFCLYNPLFAYIILYLLLHVCSSLPPLLQSNLNSVLFCLLWAV